MKTKGKKRQRWVSMWAAPGLIGNKRGQVTFVKVAHGIQELLGEGTKVRPIGLDPWGMHFQILTDRPAMLVHVVADWLGVRNNVVMWKPTMC